MPNLKGVRWNYVDAIAKSLQELEPQITEGLNNHNYDPSDSDIVLITSVKDGADGMGDVSVHKEISDRFLSDKAFRFSFCWWVVLRINVDLAIFQPYLDLEAGDNQSLKIQVARPGIEPRSSCSASQELNHSAAAAPVFHSVYLIQIETYTKMYTPFFMGLN